MEILTTIPHMPCYGCGKNLYRLNNEGQQLTTYGMYTTLEKHIVCSPCWQQKYFHEFVSQRK